MKKIKLSCFQVSDAVTELESHGLEVDFHSDNQASDAIISMILVILRDLSREQVDSLFDSI